MRVGTRTACSEPQVAFDDGDDTIEAAASDMLRSRSRLAPEVRRLKMEERRVVLADVRRGAIAHAIPIAPPAASDVFELDDSMATPARRAPDPVSYTHLTLPTTPYV